jgi:hypothetical protein
LENRVPFRQLAPRDDAEIVFASVVGLLIFLPYFSRAGIHSLVSVRIGSGLAAAFLMIVILPTWVHPMRKRLLSWAVAGLECINGTRGKPRHSKMDWARMLGATARARIAGGAE